ncbi:MAG: ABC transporter ATP-binding protein [Candidatus Thermoplasmatota archaeon]|nr:ABC transporter ATP-binding protein [Candidatus Thermoplasmatota archaeon]
MSIISADSLSKWYGEVIGLNQFTVDINKGITGIVGPNGAGKTTLFRIVTGMIRQDKGTIEVLGEKPWNNPSLNAKIGYCPEHEMLYPWMSAKEFLTSMAKMHGYGHNESEKKAYKSLETVGLNSRDMERKIKGYSKGMRQKVKVAQSIIHDPELLILDEPLAGTDPVGRKTIIELIRELANGGIHAIVSSHVLYEIEKLTEQVVLINAGQTLATGNIHEIRKLIDRHPHMVNLTTDNARKLGKELMEEESVVSARIIDEQHLSIKTREPDAFYQLLPEIIVKGKHEVNEIFSPDDNLQAVFKYLVKK